MHLKHLRESKGFSQQQFADICEIEKSTISRIERGAANTSILTLKLIADKLELELSDLFYFEH